ncbi:MAG TPA: acyl carrier protein [Burkholderiales bacterium]|jgi:acyl carrier protein|nr:acyl carrier protein [Burkholderiales bacterium]
MLNTIEVVSQLKNILNERFGIEPATLNDESRLGDFGIDSLHLVDVMLDIETALGIKLENLSLPPNPSLAEVTATISQNMEKTA